MSVTIPMGNRLADAMDWVYHLLTGWTHRWDAAHYFVQRWNSLYYVPRSWLFPYNRQFIRNIPRTYTDADNRCLHAMFSILCDFCERAHGDDGIEGYGKWCSDQLAKRAALLASGTPESELSHELNCVGQYEAGIAFLELYRWYTGVKDWNNPIGPWRMGMTDEESFAYFTAEDAFADTFRKNAARLVEHIGAMWT